MISDKEVKAQVAAMGQEGKRAAEAGENWELAYRKAINETVKQIGVPCDVDRYYSESDPVCKRLLLNEIYLN